MSTYEIPLTPTPQTFSISLSGVDYLVTVRWNVAAAAWCADLASVDGAAILAGVPLVTGADLLAQYGYLGLGGALVAQSDNDPDAVPTFDGLGVNGRLYWVTP